jgi:hypothetical protein
MKRKTKVTITIEDKDLKAGTVDMKIDFDPPLEKDIAHKDVTAAMTVGQGLYHGIIEAVTGAGAEEEEEEDDDDPS